MRIAVADIKPVYQSLSLPTLKKMFEELVQTVDRTLLSLALKATDNSQQNHHFEAVQQLRIIQRAIADDFIAAWLAPLEGENLASPESTEHLESLKKLLNPLLEHSEASVLSGDVPDILNAKHISESFLFSLAQTDLTTH